MKKILLKLYLLFALVFIGFTASAQLCSQTFSASGEDQDPTVLTISSADIVCNLGGTINSLTLTNAAGSLNDFNCGPGGLYSFDLAITGGVSGGLSVLGGCGPDFNGIDITGFTSLTITSVDEDFGFFGDLVDIIIDVEVDFIVPPCPNPSAVTASSVGAFDATITWTSGSTVFDFAYDVAPFATPAGPTSGFGGLTTASASLTGLLANTPYQYYVRADCDAGGGGTGVSNWAGPFNFTTNIDYCGGSQYTDPGGALDYGNNENVTTVICPNNPGDIVTIDFVSFNTEANYDGLLIYDGPDNTASLISSGAPAGFNATTCPAGAWQGTGGFALTGANASQTSTHPSGCLTFVFTTDGSGTFPGWVADVTCAPAPACPAPSGLGAVVTLPSTVDLSWTSSGVGNTYLLEYRVVGAGAWTAAPGNPYAGTTAQLTSLSTDNFEWQVASICAGPDTSAFASGTFTTVPYPGTCADAASIGPGLVSSAGPSTGGGIDKVCLPFANGSNAVWYAYTAGVTGTATVSSDLAINAGMDTYVEILEGACGSLTCLTSDDDGGSGFLSIATFDVCAGTTYYIQWTDRYPSGTADFDFTVAETAVCANPSTASITPTLDGFDATTTWTAGSGTCGGDYVYALVADGATPNFSTDLANGTGTYPVAIPAVTGLSDGTPYDLYVYDVCGANTSDTVLTNFTTVATCAAPGGLSAVVTLPSTVDLSWTSSGVGNTYTVEYRVVGAGAWTAAPGNPYAGTTAQLTSLSTNDFEWRIASICPGPVTSAFASGTFTTVPYPGTCATAIAIGPGLVSSAGPTTGGGIQKVCNTFAGGSNAVWYAYTAGVTGTATVSSSLPVNTGIDTYVEILDGTCGSLSCLTSNDDGGAGNTSVATFAVCAGTTYYIEWTDRWGTGSADFDFTVAETATCVAPSGATALSFNTDGLTGVNWTAGTAGACGGSFEWEVVDFGDPAFAGNDILSGTGTYPASVDFGGLMPDTDYDFYYRDNCGGGSFSSATLASFTTAALPPVNDDCADAIVVFGGYTVTGFSTSGATGTDITSCVFNDIASVWFSYTPTCDVTVEVNTNGSNYDTGLAIFDACGGSEIACDDDGGIGTQSSVTFAATNGTTYLIRVSGYNGAVGDINFSVNEVIPCPCTLNVWTGASNTDWSDGTNWTCGTAPTSACGGGTDNAIIPAGASVTPLVTGVQGVGNLEVATGSSIQIDGTLEVCGDLVHNGNPISGAGDLELMGSVAQNVSGSGRFTNLELNNANGATILAPANVGVLGSCLLTSGTLTNNGSFTLFSNATGTAYLDDFSAGATGTYSGDITVQRYVTDGLTAPGGGVGLGQRLFGSAVTAGSVSGLNSAYTGFPLGQVIPLPTCDANNLDQFSPYSNLFEWREEGPFLSPCYQYGWFAISPSTSLTPGRGYSGWMDDASTLSVTGVPNTAPNPSDITFSGTNTPSGVADAQGWHLLSNPFPSPMNIDALVGSGFSSPQYYNSSTAYSGTYQPVLAAGVEVPVMQGFVAFAGGPSTFAPENGDRIASNNPNFAKSNNWFDYKLEVEVVEPGNGADITYLYYSDASTNQFDEATDCVKRRSDADKPTLFTRMNGEELSLNGLHLNDLGNSIPMGLIAAKTGNYVFNFDGMSTFPANTSIYLEDIALGVFHNVNDGPYVFIADVAQNGTDRFMIHYVLPANFNLIEPVCEDNQAYLVELTTDGRAFDIIKDGVIESKGFLDGNKNNLASGSYQVEVFDNYGGSQVYPFLVEALDVVTTEINASSTLIEVGEAVDFDYIGSGATLFNWYVNNQAVAQTEMFNYQFDVPGIYSVELQARNNDCGAKAEQLITVSEKSTSIVNVGDKGTLSIYTNEQADIILSFNNVNQGDVKASIYNLLGQELASKTVQSVGKQKIDNVNWSNGYYIVKVQIAGEVVNQTILLNK